MLRQGLHDRCKWSIYWRPLLTALLTAQQYSQWQIPDYGASWRWSSVLEICLLKHIRSGSRYSVSFPAKGSTEHHLIKDSFREDKGRKGKIMTLPAFWFNTVTHYKINISLRANLLTEICCCSQGKAFLSHKGYQQKFWLLNWEFTETTFAYPKT